MSASGNYPADKLAVRSYEWGPVLDLATREVFEMMLGTPLEGGIETEPPKVPDITAMVSLAGEFSGIVSVRCQAASACRMAAKMLHVEEVSFDQYAKDALGEVCNMVAGNFKTKVSGVVGSCLLSVPTVITGSDYYVHHLMDGGHIHVFLSFEGHPLWVALDITG